MTSWAKEELSGIDLGDARLNKRSVKLLDRLGEKPTASMPGACKGWAEAQASYRFLAQEEIGWEDIMSLHFDCNRQRIAAHKVVLCIQDTTELNFNAQDTSELGSLIYAAQRGMYLHPTLAVSPEREPLGVLDAWMWARGSEAKSSRGLPTGAKESCRGIAGYSRIAELAATLPDTRLVYVADREADFIDLMAQAQALGTPADWLIRSVHKRKVPGRQDKLWEGFDTQHCL